MGFRPDLDNQLVSFSALTLLVLVIWPVKIVPEMTYYVSSGTLNPTHSPPGSLCVQVMRDRLYSLYVVLFFVLRRMQTSEELESRMGFHLTSDEARKIVRQGIQISTRSKLPDAVDWTQEGFRTPVRHQVVLFWC